MGTAGRSTPLRRTGSLLGLLGLELAAVLALHWLGRFAGLRIRWDEPVPWLLSSPVQEVLGAVVRTVGLVMAYWLLASTVAYLLARLTRLPSAVRAVGWATLPLVRRVADHAVAVTLATSMVGGGTLGVAGPALAADSRGGAGPPARKPVAAAQATSTTAYGFDPADQVPSSQPTTSPTEQSGTTTSTSSTTTTTEPPTTTTQPPTTTTEPPTSTTEPPTTTTEPPTTTTEPPTTTTQPPTTTTERSTTSTPDGATTTTARGAARPSPPAYRFEAAGQGTPPSTASSATPTTASSAATTTSTSGLRPPAYEFTPATTTTNPSGGREAGSGSGDSKDAGDSKDPGGSREPGGSKDQGTGARQGQEATHQVARGDNLWAIAREHLARARSGGSGEPTNREVADYWARVVEANRDGLRSGDPDLIYPGEEITLPPVD